MIDQSEVNADLNNVF